LRVYIKRSREDKYIYSSREVPLKKNDQDESGQC
jgi:hypothetical protein